MNQVGRKAFAVLLSGVTIGFVFAMYIGLGFAGSPHLSAIGGIGTALALYVCLERLYANGVFIFIGCFYLSMVGALGMAAVAARYPMSRVLSIGLWDTSLYMLAMLTVWWVCQWALQALKAYLRKVTDGRQQQAAPPGQETEARAQIQA